MKKIFYIIFSVVCMMIVVVSCKKDDMAGPNATFYGAIRDSIGNGLVEQDLQSGSTIEVWEQGFATPVAQYWLIKNNGEFRNNLVFANTYNIFLRNENFFPYALTDFVIKSGDNQHDFMVVPYIRIKNCVITRDQVANKIVATFNLEAGKPSVKVKTIQLYAFSDMYVGAYIKYSTAGTGFSQTFSPTSIISSGTTYTLTIDLAANPTLFKTGRDYFFRVGAMADVTGVGTIRTNYAPYVKITL
jgi:hypothetical protein